MFDNVVLIKDEALTAAAKKVFGDDLVLSAYIAERIITNQAEAERDLIKREYWDKGHMYDDLDGIAYDNSAIVIQFANGKYILFNNSEYGSIEEIEFSKLRFSLLSSVQNG